MYFVGKTTPTTGTDRPLTLQEVEAPRISKSAIEGGKGFSAQERSLVLISVRG